MSPGTFLWPTWPVTCGCCVVESRPASSAPLFWRQSQGSSELCMGASCAGSSRTPEGAPAVPLAAHTSSAAGDPGVHPSHPAPRSCVAQLSPTTLPRVTCPMETLTAGPRKLWSFQRPWTCSKRPSAACRRWTLPCWLAPLTRAREGTSVEQGAGFGRSWASTLVCGFAAALL